MFWNLVDTDLSDVFFFVICMEKGTESEEIVQERLAKAAREMKLQDKYKHVVFNDDLETASLDIAKIIRSYM